MIFKSIFALITTTCLITSGCTSSNTVDVESSYLEKNYSEINLQDVDNLSDLNLLQDDIGNKELILTGENHAIASNRPLNIKLVKYLKKEIDIKYYLMETQYSESYFFNKYLESGDESILDECFKATKGTFTYNEDAYNFIKDLYEFNKTLSSKDRIKIIGIDIEHAPATTIKYLSEVINKNKDQVPQDLYRFLEQINPSKTQDSTKVKEICNNLLNDIIRSEDKYKDYLKEDYVGFKLVIENIIARINAYENDDNFTLIREPKIYDNFKVLYNYLPKGKYYGQWGGFHINQETSTQDGNIECFAYLLNQDSEFEDKILSIMYAYNDSKYMDKPSNSNPNYRESTVSNVDSKLFTNYITKGKNNAIIFKLNSVGSPFNDKLIWYNSSSPDNKDKVTTDYFDYLIIINESKASKPLDL
ncbi:hypothetical protein CHL78_010825 [Romboutsia weinsteinii]|uniref:Erythromycin esterase family protein n=1 Tax=Romboutsia weinsteinii TaxID=2020949 RepID=A0A371J366_9FIRM|nr:hypothetical protein CHL78_010825 [Romboutsia weinsteinii]